MGWVIALGVLVLLAILPVGVSARYDVGGAAVSLIAGPVRFKLFPGKPKEKKEKKKPQKESPEKEKQPKSTGHPTQKSGGSFQDFLPLVQIALDFLNAFRRKLRVKRLEMRLIMASSDPCDLAVNYGKAWAALGNLMPQLERAFVIKKRNLEVECDFTADETLVIARLDLTITVGRLLQIAVWYGVRAIYQYFKIMNKRKGGARS